MRYILILLVSIGTLYCTLVGATEPRRLTYGGVPVDFVFWDPKRPSFKYSELDIDHQTRARFASQEIATLSRLYKVQLNQLSDGSVEETAVQAVLYMTQSGVSAAGNAKFWVDGFSERATIEQAYTLLSDGQRIEADPSTIQLVADSTDDIFTDSFQVIVPFAGLRPGAISVLVTKIRQDAGNRIFPWSRIYWSQWDSPLHEFDFQLTWHTDSKAPKLEQDSESIKCTREDVRGIRCKGANIPSYPSDPNVNYIDHVPALIVAEDVSWSEIRGQVRSLVENSFSKDPAIRSLLDELLIGTKSESEKLDRIYRFVSNEIRYVGLEQGVGGVVPRPTAVTLRRRFGDCKDKTTLFIEMARRAGIKAYPVLTSSKRFEASKLLLPATAYFDHMVACGTIEDNKEYCVDLTDSNSSYKFLSPGIEGKVKLDLIKFSKTPQSFRPADFGANKKVNVVNRVLSDGSIEEKITTEYYEQNATFVRSSLLPLNKVERERKMQEVYRETVSNRVTPNFEFEGLSDVSAPMRIKSFVKYPGSGNIGKTYTEFEPDLNSSIPKMRSENLHHAYRFIGKKYSARSEFQLPEGTIINYTGPSLEFETKYGSLNRRYIISKNVVIVETDLSMPHSKIAVSELPQFNRFLELVYENARIWFVMDVPPQ